MKNLHKSMKKTKKQKRFLYIKQVWEWGPNWLSEKKKFKFIEEHRQKDTILYENTPYCMKTLLQV